MDDKNVNALLELVGIRERENALDRDYFRDEIVNQLMNITLQCLGSIRLLVVEGEKERVAKDCCDVDGTNRDDGKAGKLHRQVFSNAVNTLCDTIVVGQEIDPLDPMKDLIESFPWNRSVDSQGWLMLDWAIMGDGVPLEDEEDRRSHLLSIKNILRFFPDTVNEIDKNGQHFLTYALRTNSVDIVTEIFKKCQNSPLLTDVYKRIPLHYCSYYAQSPEMLYTVVEAMHVPLNEAVLHFRDEEGNLPIHFAAQGPCHCDTMREILFACPESARIPNAEGKLPLHFAACNNDPEKIRVLISAFPDGVSKEDKNGWLPLHHAAFTCKHVEVVKAIYEANKEAMNKPHPSGRLPLHYAAVNCCSSKVMEYIIEMYPDGVKAFDVNRRLPLHNLVARCRYFNPARLRCLRLLLQYYPMAAGMAGKDGRNPLDIALRDGHGDLVLRLLLRADPTLDPEMLGEIAFRASNLKFRGEGDSPGKDTKEDN